MEAGLNSDLAYFFVSITLRTLWTTHDWAQNLILFNFGLSEFEVNVVIILQDDHLITENFPIKIARL